ncbi:SIR2 family protein [Pontibacillus sp. ALD_SL1]|uniref:SIR2 family protein n=1 Tax=Pontibacillus sp. ALD_SL1 TaxID=2777185 RepID=UPI001A95D82A|nr:SIR2 family protein [Pontibacillus sp. ALD_SL1]QSS99545.1 SIR2 family protein [Pontibacillus sp. ALD_SL1]
MQKVVLTGNGLSVGLNASFALENITRRFFERLPDEHKDFIEHHMERLQEGTYDQRDFEKAISSIEQTYDSLKNYYDFLNDEDNGLKFMQAYDLEKIELEKHIEAVQSIIYEYTASILDLIDNQVRKPQIHDKLQHFVDWLEEIIGDTNEVDLFTLNFDLLLETILLDIRGPGGFIDFHRPENRPWEVINGNQRYFFSPSVSRMIGDSRIRLHHLHGSLSSFKDIKTAKTFKITTEALRDNNVYDNIFAMNIVPSIITGGGKSVKVQDNPFHFYYNEFTKVMVDNNHLCDELYIIGYSFRDDHINKAISERLKLSRTQDRDLKLVICDFKTDDDEKKAFIDDINKQLSLGPRTSNRFVYGDERVIFEGANAISQFVQNDS